MGAFCSLIFISISLIFLLSKIMVLANVSQISLVTNYVVGALNYTEKFTKEDGFLVAAALTKYDSDPEPLYDPRHGDLTIEYYGWGGDVGISSEA